MDKLGRMLCVVCGLALAACGGKDKAGEDIVTAGDLGSTPDGCVPYCGEYGEAQCGDDGCGGSCGACEPGAVCGEADYDDIGICFDEVEQCPGICGDAECGFVWTGLWEPEMCECGTCPAGTECVGEYDEEGGYCSESCEGDDCPEDECWASQGQEGGLGSPCESDDDCIFVVCREPTFGGAKICTCHCLDECPEGFSCAQEYGVTPDVEFACFPPCLPDCAGNECGDDGCGGICGTCPPPLACVDGDCHCQTVPATAWSHCLDSSDEESAAAVVSLGDNTLLVAANATHIEGDIYDRSIRLLKLDQEGGVLWSKYLESDDDQEASALAETPDGQVILVGDAQPDWGNDDALIMAFDAKGEVVWEKTLGKQSDDAARAVVVTPDGSLAFAGTTPAENPAPGASPSDLWLVRMKPNGDTIWQKSFGGNGHDMAFSLVALPEGGFAVAGRKGAEPGSPGASVPSAWLLRVNAEGNLVWDATFGGSDYGEATSVRRMGDGGFAVLGLSRETGGSGFDVMLVRTTGAGDILWQKTFDLGPGLLSSAAGIALETPEAGGFLLAGFGEHPSSPVGPKEAWLIRTSAQGALLWQSEYGVPDGFASAAFLAQAMLPDGGHVLVGSCATDLTEHQHLWTMKLTNECP